MIPASVNSFSVGYAFVLLVTSCLLLMTDSEPQDWPILATFLRSATLVGSGWMAYNMQTLLGLLRERRGPPSQGFHLGLSSTTPLLPAYTRDLISYFLHAHLVKFLF